MKAPLCFAPILACIVWLPGVLWAGPETGSAGRNRVAGQSLEAGDPVSAANGAFSFELPLLSLGGPMGLDFTLLYDQSAYNYAEIQSGLGLPAWGNQHFWWTPAAIGHFWASYDQGMNVVCLPNCAQASFVLNNTGEFVLYEESNPELPANRSPVRYQMKAGTNHVYLMDPSNQRVYVFNKLTAWPYPLYKINPVQYVLDRNGNCLTYQYAKTYKHTHEVTNIHDSLGRSLSFAYTNLGGESLLLTTA